MTPQKPTPCRMVLLHYGYGTPKVTIPAVVVRVHEDGTVDLNAAPGPYDSMPERSMLSHVMHAPTIDGVEYPHSMSAASWWTWPPRA